MLVALIVDLSVIFFNFSEIYFYISFQLYAPFCAHLEEETEGGVFSTPFPPVGFAIANSNTSEPRRPKKHKACSHTVGISVYRAHFVNIYPLKGCSVSCASCAYVYVHRREYYCWGWGNRIQIQFFFLDLHYGLNVCVPPNFLC